MKSNIVLHPFLFGSYPVIFLLAVNMGQIHIIDALRPMIEVLLATTIFMLLFKFLTKNWHKAGLEVSFLIFMVFSYGHFYNLFLEKGILGRDQRPLMIIWTVILIHGVWGGWRLLKDVTGITRILNLVSSLLLIIPLFQIVVFFIQSPHMPEPNKDQETETYEIIPINLPRNPPDIYYLVLDGYARDDILLQVYGYDNSKFLSFLMDNGFYIASESFGNYIQTLQSLSSSMNMEYINYMSEYMGEKSENRDPLVEMVQKSVVRGSLERVGYQTINISSGFMPTQFRDADIYLSSETSELDNFSSMLWMTTPAIVFENGIQYNAHRDRFLFEVESLKWVPTLNNSKPKFVFAHIYLPHPPFVFGPNGEPIHSKWVYNVQDGNYFFGSPEEYIVGYRDQITYLNKLLEEIITQILANSVATPIIILQADHGPGALLNWDSVDGNLCLKERTAILNAYLFPESELIQIDQSISPVNSFRMLFDIYFDTNLGTLEDRTYYSSWFSPYEFIDVTDSFRDKCITGEH